MCLRVAVTRCWKATRTWGAGEDARRGEADRGGGEEGVGGGGGGGSGRRRAKKRSPTHEQRSGYTPAMRASTRASRSPPRFTARRTNFDGRTRRPTARDAASQSDSHGAEPEPPTNPSAVCLLLCFVCAAFPVCVASCPVPVCLSVSACPVLSSASFRNGANHAANRSATSTQGAAPRTNAVERGRKRERRTDTRDTERGRKVGRSHLDWEERTKKNDPKCARKLQVAFGSAVIKEGAELAYSTEHTGNAHT
jgi:hypothetical protein